MTAIDNGAKANGDGDPFRPMNTYDPNEEPSLVSTPLHIAAMSSHSSIVELLLMYISKEYSMDQISSKGPATTTSTTSGGDRTSNELTSTAGPQRAKHEAIFRALNARNEKLATPLHLAAQVGSVSCCMVLISHGAQLDALDRLGETPLHYCVKHLTKDSASVVNLLLSIRANPWIRSKGGDEEYDVAVSKVDENSSQGGKYALDSLPSISKCAARGPEIFMVREKIMDALRAHMGLPEMDATPPHEFPVGTLVEVCCLSYFFQFQHFNIFKLQHRYDFQWQTEQKERGDLDVSHEHIARQERESFTRTMFVWKVTGNFGRIL